MGDPWGNGNPLHYSCLGNLMDRGAWWVAVHGVTRVGHDWTTEYVKILNLCAQMCSVLGWRGEKPVLPSPDKLIWHGSAAAMLGPKMPYPYPTQAHGQASSLLKSGPYAHPTQSHGQAPSLVKNGSSYHVRVSMEAGWGLGHGTGWPRTHPREAHPEEVNVYRIWRSQLGVQALLSDWT